MSDRELAERAQGEGGDAAYREIYERYRGSVHGFLVRMLGDQAQAEDLVQEAFLRAFRNLHRFDSERAFRPWLFGIARNAALDALRSRKKDQKLASALASEPGPIDLVPEVQQREDVERLRAALGALPPETRALLVQRHGMCMKLDELAESFACTERTVRNRLKRAAALLAQELVSRKPTGGRS